MNGVTTIIFMTSCIMVAQRWHQYESISTKRRPRNVVRKIFQGINHKFCWCGCKELTAGSNTSRKKYFTSVMYGAVRDSDWICSKRVK